MTRRNYGILINEQYNYVRQSLNMLEVIMKCAAEDVEITTKDFEDLLCESIYIRKQIKREVL